MLANRKKDYRNTSECHVLDCVEQNKRNLEKEIKEIHKKAEIMYNIIHEKKSIFFKKFSAIYNNKCAYCGTSIDITGIQLFEIDHFICEASFPNNKKGRIMAGRISNLVLACQDCNRKKSNFIIDKVYQEKLNPDDGSIANVFERNKDYYIKIQPQYTNDKLISSFYQKLLLGSEFRRLDYLLLEMKNLITILETSKPTIATKLQKCLLDLILKRNTITP